MRTPRRGTDPTMRVNWSIGLLLAAALLVVAAGTTPLEAAVLDTDTLGDLRVEALSPETAGLAPDLTAPAAILVAPDGRVLWARSADEQRAMASTTKIMTATVALERAELTEMVTISRRAAGIGEAAARLREGTAYPLGTLLEGMLVKSGNDAAIAIAEHIGGSVEGFADLMNAKAAELGLENTNFVNPHGLTADDHYSSAADLATMARYAMAKPEFRRMVALETTVIENTDGPGELENSNVLITTLEGATGVKTGWTNRAGYCLVSSAEREGTELFAVVLGTDQEMARFQEAGLLLEWGFIHYTEERLVEAGEQAGSIPVADYIDRSIEVVVGEPSVVHVFGPAGEVERVVSIPEAVDAPVRVGDRIGTLSLVQGERLIDQVPLVAAESMRRPTVPERIWISFVRGWRSLFGEPEGVPAL